MTNFDPGVNDGVPFFSTDFLSVRQFRDLDIYSECFRLLGMAHHGAVHVPTGDGHRLWFGLERAGRTAFSERDRLMLTLAQPHLANALQLARSRQALRTERSPDPAAFGRAGFTSREAEVAHWLTEGKSNVEIAQILRLHVQTVKSHVTRLFNRTGCGNRLALTLHLLEVARRPPAENPPLHRVPVRPDPPR